MAVVIYLRRAAEDVLRLADFAQVGEQSSEVVKTIEDAVSVLARHPLIGRRVGRGRRKLVISWGRTGYVAIYRYDPDDGRFLVIAIRHQREAGYGD